MSGFETNLMMGGVVKTIYFRSIIVNLKIVTWLIQITSTALLTCFLSHLERLPTNSSISLLQDMPAIRCRNRTMSNADVCPPRLLENPESVFEITQNVSRTATHYSSSVSYRRPGGRSCLQTSCGVYIRAMGE